MVVTFHIMLFKRGSAQRAVSTHLAKIHQPMPPNGNQQNRATNEIRPFKYEAKNRHKDHVLNKTVKNNLLASTTPGTLLSIYSPFAVTQLHYSSVKLPFESWYFFSILVFV